MKISLLLQEDAACFAPASPVTAAAPAPHLQRKLCQSLRSMKTNYAADDDRSKGVTRPPPGFGVRRALNSHIQMRTSKFGPFAGSFSDIRTLKLGVRNFGPLTNSGFPSFSLPLATSRSSRAFALNSDRPGFTPMSRTRKPNEPKPTNQAAFPIRVDLCPFVVEPPIVGSVHQQDPAIEGNGRFCALMEGWAWLKKITRPGRLGALPTFPNRQRAAASQARARLGKARKAFRPPILASLAHFPSPDLIAHLIESLCRVPPAPSPVPIFPPWTCLPAFHSTRTSKFGTRNSRAPSFCNFPFPALSFTALSHTMTASLCGPRFL